MYVPILRVTTPSKPTVKGLAEVLLEGRGAVDATRGTENERTRRVKCLMRNTGTRMLMIDEFQHFFDKGTKLIMHHVADWLKILVDETRCALVVAGLPSCQTVIDSNDGSVEAKAHIVRAVLSRKLPVVGDVDGTVAGLLVSYEGFQRLAHDERARANGDTSTIAEAARQLECNTTSVRRLVELEWLRARQTPKAFRVTEGSIAEFKKRYVSLLSIARTTNGASWALKNICKRCNLPMLIARQSGKKSSQAFIRAEQREELLSLRSGRSLKSRSR